ncbi:helix-turn-helix domain-containing protein [Cupriavidus necator]
MAAEHGVAASVVRRWVGRFKQHGKAGLVRKSGIYSEQFKLSVVQHMEPVRFLVC